MKYNKPYAVAVLGLLSLVWLIPADATEEESPEGGADFSADYARQAFSDSDGDVTTLTASPWVRWGDWEARIDLPWLRATGEYIIPGATPRVIKICEFANTFPKLVQQLLNKGRITQEQLNQCNNLAGGTSQSDESGVGDVTLWLNKLVPLGSSEYWALLPQLGYKTDTGDETAGLGSGTRDAMAEIGLSGQFERLNLFLLGGYNRVVTQPEESGLDDYSYTLLEVEWQLLEPLGVGARWNYESAKADYLDEMNSVTGFLTWRFLDSYSMRAYLQSYEESEGYPEQESGVSLNATF